MDGKQNWMKTATLVLCAVLLAVNLWQGKRLLELERAVWSAQNSVMDDIRNMRSSLSSRLGDLERTDRLVQDWDYTTSVDVEKRCLLIDVSMMMKEWREDTEAELCWTNLNSDGEGSVLLAGDGAGTFTGVLELPAAEPSDGISLDVLIQNDGTRYREKLGGWGDLSMLLPLQTKGGSWGGPEYRDGKTASDFSIDLENTCGTKIVEPHFRVYLNGELAQEVPAELREDICADSGFMVCYAPALPDRTWSMACETGDQIRITFCCQDGFGLGYEFPFMEWTIEGVTPDNQAGSGATSGSGILSLTWPE